MVRKDKGIVSSSIKKENGYLDLTLRPKTLTEFVGQKRIKENLKIFIEAAQKRKESLEHVLLYGPCGIGKTTLAHIIARESGANIRITTGPAIEKAGDLGAILTNLSNRDVLFIDEIHRMNKTVEEVLYPAMEDYVLDIIIGKGPSARSLRLDLPKFTIIGATTRVGLLSSPLRDRFGNIYRLDYYSNKDIENILKRSAKILGIDLDSESCQEIAKRSRKTPRVANRLLKRIRDFAQVKTEGKINLKIIQEAFTMLEIDELGLDQVDKRILDIMIKKFQGGPVGLQALAAASSEERDTIEEVYEPFLLQLGFIARTPKGRVVTESGYKHLGIEYNKNQSLLFK